MGDPLPSQSGWLAPSAVANSENPSMNHSVLGRAAGRAKGQRRVGFGDDSHRTITGRWEKKHDSPSSEDSLNLTGWAKMSNYNAGCVNGHSPRTSVSDYSAFEVKDETRKPQKTKNLQSQKKAKSILKNRKARYSMPAIAEVGSDSSDGRRHSESRTSHPLEFHKRLVQKKKNVVRPRAQSTLVYSPRNRLQIERGYQRPQIERGYQGNPPWNNPAPHFERRRRTRT